MNDSEWPDCIKCDEPAEMVVALTPKFGMPLCPDHLTEYLRENGEIEE